ncbi:MAG: acyl-CoA/acyl-ACP dehydrogenase [Chloroflexi bacterium]|nr:acyl-CoA/acyl-ACP dehydrogenase [Chloroflexota bacterium]MBV9897244.1 acyl-CoA/acyl-ACP dehydrogenase [Chloroflexota bacterium]
MTAAPLVADAPAADPSALLDAAVEVAAGLAAHADPHHRAGVFAPDNIVAIWRAGLGNLTLPVADGGRGADLRTTAHVVEILAGGDASTALILVMHLLHLRALGDPRSPWPLHPRERVIAETRDAPSLINALRVESELGTPARGGIPATRARRVDRRGRPGWQLTGHKIYGTGSAGLRWMLVWPATDRDDPERQRVGYVVVPADSPGITIRRIWDHLGMRASASNDVLFEDVWIPLDDTLNLQPPGSAQSGGSWLWSTTLLLSVYNGVAKAGRDWLVRYLNERVPSNLGAPLATLPRFQTAIGEIESLLFVNDRLPESLSGDNPPASPSLAKLTVTANVIKSLEIGLTLTGNPGLSFHHPLQRHYRDALCSRIHTPQDDVILLNAGKTALGI